ncbi:MAG: HD domain-containing protein [Bacteroidales bacterium]|nr:HD domain-containing protein [Candidatus Scybalocola fimicaballi]
MMSDKIKNEFLELLRSTGRDVEDMIEELESNGFMEAPASAGHHLNVAGGLVEHSLNTCKSALAIWEGMKTLNPSLEKSTPKDSVIIAALLHDVCKSDVYFRTVKQKKNKATGTWEESEGYKVSYKNFPMGHGEKSVIMILPFLELTDAEMLAIRWHMGAWSIDKSNYEEVRNYDTACKLNPLVPIIHAADMLSSHLLESGGDDEDL